MKCVRIAPLAAAAAFLACGGEGAGDETARDLQLAPAESIAALADTAAAEPARTPAARPQGMPSRTARGETPRETRVEEPRTVTLTAAEGTVIQLFAGDTLTSRHNEQGEAVQAVLIEPVLDAEGRVVIPPQSIFLGTISDIAPAESPGGEGRMVLTFTRVQIGDQVFGVQARTDSIGAHMKGRGVTAGDAAKVGAGAVVGAIAGRIIGGNRTGTAVGAAAGAAAGAGIAAATRDIDIILPQGAPIRLILTAPFEVELAVE